MNWEYLYLRNGRLVYEGGEDVNAHWPGFAGVAEAEAFLEREDIRATVVGSWQSEAPCNRA